jgi:hypothetical protein
MITEGRRQFIPREEGDPELTESEVSAHTDNKALQFLKRAGVAAAIGAAMLNAESAPAQELSSFEKQKMEEVMKQFRDEQYCQILVDITARNSPELKPILSDAMVREADPSKAGKFGESEYYVYLPNYHVVLTVPFNNLEDEPQSDSDEAKKTVVSKGIQEFRSGLIAGLIKHGIIELKRDPQGEITITIIPHDRSQSDAENKAKPELRKY